MYSKPKFQSSKTILLPNGQPSSIFTLYLLIYGVGTSSSSIESRTLFETKKIETNITTAMYQNSISRSMTLSFYKSPVWKQSWRAGISPQNKCTAVSTDAFGLKMSSWRVRGIMPTQTPGWCSQVVTGSAFVEACSLHESYKSLCYFGHSRSKFRLRLYHSNVKNLIMLLWLPEITDYNLKLLDENLIMTGCF